MTIPVRDLKYTEQPAGRTRDTLGEVAAGLGAAGLVTAGVGAAGLGAADASDSGAVRGGTR